MIRNWIRTTVIVAGFLSLSVPVSAPALAEGTKTASAAETAEQLAIAKRKRFGGDVILMRGGFDIFSRGIDSIAEKLNKRGVKAKVLRHTQRDVAVKQILTNRKKFGRKPVVLIGHSLGANAVIDIATRLRKKGVRVTYMATFAATNPAPIPANVRKATNYYFETDGWGKPVKKGKGARGNVKNIDLSKTPGVHHFNIEKSPRLQRQVIRNVLRFVRPNKRA